MPGDAYDHVNVQTTRDRHIDMGSAPVATVTTPTLKVAECPSCSCKHLYYEDGGAVVLLNSTPFNKAAYSQSKQDELDANKGFLCGCGSIFKVA